MAAGLYRPMYVHAVKVGLDAQGRIAGWQHTVVGQSIMAGTPMAAMIKNGVDRTSVEGVAGTPYALPTMSADLHSPALAVRPLWWRSVGSTHTAYVMETMMDELARAAGQDPLAFRLALLDKSERAAAVLKLAAEKAGWGRTMPAGVAQGLAMHESFGSYVAQVAEVSMKDGKVQVERVVCAIDCGVAVNPDVVRAQMEGCIGFALGALYYGEIELRNGARGAAQLRHLPGAAHPRDAEGRGPHRAQHGRAQRCRRARRAAAGARGRERGGETRRAEGAAPAVCTCGDRGDLSLR